MRNLKENLVLFLKGVGVGAANVIPGVSGGTIAFITNIYEEFINALKSLDLKAIRLLMKFRWKEFSEHVNLWFLIVLFAGIGISIISIGRLLKFLFENFPVHIWAFFFGLILASVYFVGKKIDRWRLPVVFMLATGATIAVAISFLKPAAESENFLYLILCGVVAIMSMLLPGISGSFVLILMGNYELLFLEAVPSFDMKIIFPLGLGAIIGMSAFSHAISYILKHFRDATIALLTGFILGSLLIIWPWKNEIFLTDQAGNFILKDGAQVVESYERYFPDLTLASNLFAIVLIIAGIATVWLVESLGEKRTP